MEERWEQLWISSGYLITEKQKRDLYKDLVRHYSAPHRAYHTLGHIEHCLIEFEEVRGLAENPLAVEFALWYHDFVYQSREHDNEATSALVLSFVMTDLKIPLTFTCEVVEHIFATKHTGVAKKRDSKLVVDIDLSILGQSEEVFDEYERQVRFEYSWVPEEVFHARRAAILQEFLDRPAIFQTTHFRKKFEQLARANLARSIQKLQIIA